MTYKHITAMQTALTAARNRANARYEMAKDSAIMIHEGLEMVETLLEEHPDHEEATRYLERYEAVYMKQMDAIEHTTEELDALNMALEALDRLYDLVWYAVDIIDDDLLHDDLTALAQA